MTRSRNVESQQDSIAKHTEDDTIVIPGDTPESLTEGKIRFEDLDLPSEILAAIEDLGFQYCTPIQEAILSQVIDGGDAAGQSQTGTGKSAAFLISILTRLLKHDEQGKRPPGSPGALIMAPTRELVCQIEQDALGLAKFTSFSIASAYESLSTVNAFLTILGSLVNTPFTSVHISSTSASNAPASIAAV